MWTWPKHSSPFGWFESLSDWSFIACQIHVRNQKQNKKKNKKCVTGLACGFVVLGMESSRLIFSSACGKKKLRYNTDVSRLLRTILIHTGRAKTHAKEIRWYLLISLIDVVSVASLGATVSSSWYMTEFFSTVALLRVIKLLRNQLKYILHTCTSTWTSE